MANLPPVAVLLPVLAQGAYPYEQLPSAGEEKFSTASLTAHESA